MLASRFEIRCEVPLTNWTLSASVNSPSALNWAPYPGGALNGSPTPLDEVSTSLGNPETGGHCKPLGLRCRSWSRSRSRSRCRSWCRSRWRGWSRCRWSRHLLVPTGRHHEASAEQQREQQGPPADGYELASERLHATYLPVRCVRTKLNKVQADISMLAAYHTLGSVFYRKPGARGAPVRA